MGKDGIGEVVLEDRQSEDTRSSVGELHTFGREKENSSLQEVHLIRSRCLANTNNTKPLQV